MDLKIGNDMNDYPKFSFDKSRIPPLSPEITERVKEYERRMVRYVALPDPYAPSMSFEKFIELMSKRQTKHCPRIAFSFNPDDKEHWLFKFANEYLKDNGADE